eukprot:CAMPEP_0170395288 /NCGR_PEP_ID=MMETSP0117_2-20130122/21698_1 /TAXON_ID=400756 /ORGANISM="Durinskia baltica, Strain CSIRO CS-38" /LENGTH=52 /DNA_ID=CAMNT_0010651587 /DNA_START=202 /DNA_END=360 /DNA_ORIENTATION=+
MDSAKDKTESGTTAQLRNFVNENVVKSLQSSSNFLFSQDPKQYVKRMFSGDK